MHLSSACCCLNVAVQVKTTKTLTKSARDFFSYVFNYTIVFLIMYRESHDFFSIQKKFSIQNSKDTDSYNDPNTEMFMGTMALEILVKAIYVSIEEDF